MAALEITKKLHVYHILYRLNLSFSNVVGYCQTLQEAGIFKLKDMRLYQGYTQELQSDINHFVLEDLHSIELDDWASFGQIRQAEEKRLRDPDDVFIHAEERRRELRKKHKRNKGQRNTRFTKNEGQKKAKINKPELRKNSGVTGSS
jgi:hypothetical protein